MEVVLEEDGEVEGALMALGATGFLTRESEPSGATLVDSRNGFNNVIRLAMMWTVWESLSRGGEVRVQLV